MRKVGKHIVDCGALLYKAERNNWILAGWMVDVADRHNIV